MPLDLRPTAATSRSGAEQRLIVLQHLTAALARTRTYSGIAAVIIEEALPALSASVGVVALVSEDRTTLRNVGFRGVDAATESAWQTYPVASPVPVAESALRGEPVIVRTLAERNARYPVLAEIHGLEHGGPVTAFPLWVDGRLLGVLAFCWDTALELDDDDLSFLTTLGEQCGLAIERARLYEVAERELAVRTASEEKLREANARKDEFLAMLAHELRNPLAPLRSAADLLAMVSGGDPRLTRIQDVLARQTEHMRRIVDDLLDVSRLARASVVLERKDVDIVEIVRATTNDHASSFTAAGIRLQVDLSSEPLWVRADVTRLSQALANLLHNAAKFTPRGGTVKVRVARTPEGAAVDVVDDGVGIEAELLSRLFVPFAQGDRSLARSAGGLGLGLSVVRGLVELHGGTVTATSEGAGKGAAFRVVVPLDGASPSARGEVESSSGARTRRRVLVVEDNPDAADLLGVLVDMMGHEVRVAHHAEEGLAILESWPADIVFSDLGLPDVDGFEFARRMRTLDAHAATTLVALSGYGSERDKAKAREAGFDRHLTKPLDAAMLAGVLDPSAAQS